MMTSSVVGGRASGTGLPAELTEALVSLWTQYAGKPPSRARTEIRGNVVTCVLVDAVADYNRSMVAPKARDTVEGVGKRTSAGYKREAVAAVVRLTRQRVVSFISSHDRDTDVATEVFTLEPSLSRGASRADRGLRQASWLPPPAAPSGVLVMDSVAPQPSEGSNFRLVELEANSRYARERYQLYRAKSYGSRLTSPERLRRLKRESELAERRLGRAKTGDRDAEA